MSRRNTVALTIIATLTCIGAVRTPSCGALELVKLVENKMTTYLSYSPDPIAVGQWAIFSAAVTTEGDVTVRRYVWSVDGVPVLYSESSTFGLSFDSEGQHSVEVRVEADFSGVSKADEALMYVDVQPAGSGGSGGNSNTSGNDNSGGSGTDDPGPTVTVTVSGPDEIHSAEEVTYTATVSGTTNYRIRWDVQGSAFWYEDETDTTITLTGASPGFGSVIAEAHDPDTDALLATGSLTVAVTSEYRIYLTSQICTNGQLEVFSESAVSNGIKLCTLAGGGNDCSVWAALTPVSGPYPTAAEAVQAFCPELSAFYDHYWAGWIATYGGSETCLGDSLLSAGVLDACGAQ